jgi:hypothetical protein
VSAILRLHADHPDGRVEGLGGDHAAGGQPAPADRHHQRAHLIGVGEDLDGDGAAADNRLRGVGRRHDRQATRGGQIGHHRVAVLAAAGVEDHLGPQRAGRFHLQLRRVGGNHDGRVNADLPGRPG